MPDWIHVMAAEDCPPGESRETVVSGQIVAIFHAKQDHGGQFFALDGVCPHQGGPLGKGCLADGIVTCPWHGWQFELSTGKNVITPTITQPRYEIKQENGQIYVQI